MSKQEHEIELEEMLEYTTRILYFKTDYTGTMWCPTKANFHPNLFKGTQQQYDEIFEKYLMGHEDEFKVIGVHKFDTLEEYNEAFGFNK